MELMLIYLLLHLMCVVVAARITVAARGFQVVLQTLFVLIFAPLVVADAVGRFLERNL